MRSIMQRQAAAGPAAGRAGRRRRGGIRPEMPPARLAQHAAAAGAQDQTLLDQIGLDHVLQRVARLGQRRGQRFHPDRAAMVMLGDAAQIAAVHRVQPEPVDLQPGQRRVGVGRGPPGCARRRRRNRAPGAAAARRCAACRGTAGRSRRRRPAVRSKPQLLGAARHDQLQLRRRVEHQPQRNAEAVAQRRRQQPGAGGGADQGERRQVDAHASAPPAPRR